MESLAAAAGDQSCRCRFSRGRQTFGTPRGALLDGAKGQLFYNFLPFSTIFYHFLQFSTQDSGIDDSYLLGWALEIGWKWMKLHEIGCPAWKIIRIYQAN